MFSWLVEYILFSGFLAAFLEYFDQFVTTATSKLRKGEFLSISMLSFISKDALIRFHL